MWSEPLEQVLRWIDRPVDFVKIDAQGMDLEVVRSGGARLPSVRRISMEVRPARPPPRFRVRVRVRGRGRGRVGVGV